MARTVGAEAICDSVRARIVEMRRNGLRAKEIANEFGIAVDTVYSICSKARVFKIKRRKEWN